MMARSFVFALVASALLVWSTPSPAFVRTTTCLSICNNTCASAGDGVCDDESTCEFGSDCTDCGYRPQEGDSRLHCREGETPLPIAWPDGGTFYTVNSAGSLDIQDFEGELLPAIHASFDAWNALDCSQLFIEYAGLTEERQPGFLLNAPNTNFVAFVEEGWNSIPGHPPTALALTSVTYDLLNGEIVDADIEMNGANFNFATNDVYLPTANLHDLQNTLTHEVGHFLGLDHADERTHVFDGDTYRDATMFASTPPGELSKRELSTDDIAGACSIYGDGYDPDPPRDKRGCDCSTTPTGGAGALAFLALLALVRRRR